MLPLLLVIGGCATTELIHVPQSDWRLVPEKQRVEIDHQIDAELVTARAELHAAEVGLAAAKKLPPPAHHPVTGDPERAAAAAQIDAMQAAWAKAYLAWNQQRVAAATARIAVISFERELVRAKAVDHSLPVGDTYDTAAYRGQLAEAQGSWYAAESGANQARAALENASAHIASAKEAYAQLMKHRQPDGSIGALERAKRMQLPDWAINDDIGYRHRMKYVLADTKPMLVRR